ncbi:DUF1801 domain-containing protein [Leeuwenhoekiella sp. A16]|uniref:DUF1801 domain-containing protein n=1 Tax=unclassified Leeuwenhoekiella TaxID=2615029 RepID=UPI003A7FFC44
MAKLKTQPNDKNVLEFLTSVTPEQRRKDGIKLYELFHAVVKEPAVMWGDAIVGYGNYHYKYESGREGDWFLTGFSPRKQYLSLYLYRGFDTYEDLLSKLGKHRVSTACIYINKLADVDLMVLKELIEDSVNYMREKYK